MPNYRLRKLTDNEWKAKMTLKCDAKSRGNFENVKEICEKAERFENVKEICEEAERFKNVKEICEKAKKDSKISERSVKKQ